MIVVAMGWWFVNQGDGTNYVASPGQISENAGPLLFSLGGLLLVVIGIIRYAARR